MGHEPEERPEEHEVAGEIGRSNACASINLKWAGAKPLDTIDMEWGGLSAVAQMHCDVFEETEDDLRKVLQGPSFNGAKRTVTFKWIPKPKWFVSCGESINGWLAGGLGRWFGIEGIPHGDNPPF